MLQVPTGSRAVSPSWSVRSSSTSASFVSNQSVHIDQFIAHTHVRWYGQTLLPTLKEQFATRIREAEFKELIDGLHMGHQSGDLLVILCHIDVQTQGDNGHPGQKYHLPLFLMAFANEYDLKSNVRELRTYHNVFYAEPFSLFKELDQPTGYLKGMIDAAKQHLPTGAALIVDIESTPHGKSMSLLPEYRLCGHNFLPIKDIGGDPELRQFDHKFCLEDALATAGFSRKARSDKWATTAYWIWQMNVGGFVPMQTAYAGNIAAQQATLRLEVELAEERRRRREELRRTHAAEIELVHKKAHGKK